MKSWSYVIRKSGIIKYTGLLTFSTKRFTQNSYACSQILCYSNVMWDSFSIAKYPNLYVWSSILDGLDGGLGLELFILVDFGISGVFLNHSKPTKMKMIFNSFKAGSLYYSFFICKYLLQDDFKIFVSHGGVWFVQLFWGFYQCNLANIFIQ